MSEEPKKKEKSSMAGFLGLILLASGFCGLAIVGLEIFPSLLVAVGGLILAIELVNGRLKLFG